MQEKGNGSHRAIVDNIPKGDIKIIMGDFNAKIASDNSDYDDVMGCYGLEKISENGEI